MAVPRHAAAPLRALHSWGLQPLSAPAWTSLLQFSSDKLHETFLTFLKCVANQEWLLMCGGSSNWGDAEKRAVMMYSCIRL